MMNIAMLLSRIRVEEKLLLQAFEKQGLNIDIIDDRQVIFDLHQNGWSQYNVVVERCVNHSRALYALRILNDWGIPTVNSYEVALICGPQLLPTPHPAQTIVVEDHINDRSVVLDSRWKLLHEHLKGPVPYRAHNLL